MSQLQVAQRSPLSLLDETMQQRHFAGPDRETDTRNLSPLQLTADLPKVRFQLSDQWHTERPAELYQFDILADDLSILFVEPQQPFPNWFTARLGAKEQDAQDGLHADLTSWYHTRYTMSRACEGVDRGESSELPSISGLEPHGINQILALHLGLVGCFAPLPSLMDAFPTNEIQPRFVVGIELVKLARHQSAIEVLAQYTVLLLVQGQTPFQQFHLHNKLIDFHLSSLAPFLDSIPQRLRLYPTLRHPAKCYVW